MTGPELTTMLHTMSRMQAMPQYESRLSLVIKTFDKNKEFCILDGSLSMHFA